MSTKRTLTETEQQFVTEAEAGGFGLSYDDEGKPFAQGADKTGNLFSMDVEERPDGEGSSLYFLRG